jgi:hypothetical protein
MGNDEPNNALEPAMSHLRELIERERGGADGSQRQREEREFVVVARDAVGAELPAPDALVDDGPFAVGSGRDGDWFHGLIARRASIADLVVHMTGPETGRAMVALARAERLVLDGALAVHTGEPA